MKILFVSNCYPWPLDSGMYQRVYHLAEGLARWHQVTLVVPVSSQRASHGSSKVLPLEDYCERVIEVDTKSSLSQSSRQFHYWAPPAQRLHSLISSVLPCVVRQSMSKELCEALKEIRSRETFDLVWAERPGMGEIARSAGFEKVAVDVDDLESVSLARYLARSSWYRSKPLHYAELAKLYAYERLLPYRFSQLVVCKEQDRQFFGNGCENVFIVPNGVPSLPPLAYHTEQPGEILFVGTLSYYPNIDAVQFFQRSILPEVRKLRPDAHLTVVGKEPESAVLATMMG